MNKNLSLMAVLVVALLTGLAPVRTAQAAPFGQMRALGNFNHRLTRVPCTILNTQSRYGNFNTSLVTCPSVRSIGALQTTRAFVVERITQVAPPVVTLDASRYLHSVDVISRRPSTLASMLSLYKATLQAIPELPVNTNNGNGSDNDGGGKGGDGDDHDGGDENERKDGGKGGSGSGSPPDVDRIYYYDDDDDE